MYGMIYILNIDRYDSNAISVWLHDMYVVYIKFGLFAVSKKKEYLKKLK